MSVRGIAGVRGDIPIGKSNFWDGQGKILLQDGHLQYEAVAFDALGIEQEGLNQTSWEQPLAGSDLKPVLHQGAWRL